MPQYCVYSVGVGTIFELGYVCSNLSNDTNNIYLLKFRKFLGITIYFQIFSQSTKHKLGVVETFHQFDQKRSL